MVLLTYFLTASFNFVGIPQHEGLLFEYSLDNLSIDRLILSSEISSDLLVGFSKSDLGDLSNTGTLIHS